MLPKEAYEKAIKAKLTDAQYEQLVVAEEQQRQEAAAQRFEDQQAIAKGMKHRLEGPGDKVAPEFHQGGAGPYNWGKPLRDADTKRALPEYGTAEPRTAEIERPIAKPKEWWTGDLPPGQEATDAAPKAEKDWDESGAVYRPASVAEPDPDESFSRGLLRQGWSKPPKEGSALYDAEQEAYRRKAKSTQPKGKREDFI
jgi:hypothetical protein